jgi:site-specific DNA recombinase
MATAEKIALDQARNIPFNQLRLSQSNVRRVKAGVSLEELADDIGERGLLQSLNVRPDLDEAGAEIGTFEVPAGGRRYRALELLVRDQADTATLYKHLRFAGVPIVTLSEGEITELHVGLKGTMNAIFLKDLAAKTHRGLRGRVEKGRSGGGLCYGYTVVKLTDEHGEPIRGQRTINGQEAENVRRVFGAFAAGVSPKAIARRLNAERVPGPEDKLWSDSTIRGHAMRGTGLINNELYVGRLVWNRLRYIKDPNTGKRVSRVNPREKWITTDVPELRIVEDALWQAVKQRQAEIETKYANVISAVRAAHANRLNGTHRPRSLLSGLLVCGCCGGPYALRGQDRFACSNHIMNGSCSNSRTIAREALEARMLAGLRERLMAPEVAAEAMRAYAEETNRLNWERRSSAEANRRELEKIQRAIQEIVTMVEDGRGSRSLVQRLRDLEAREDDLRNRLNQPDADTPDILPTIAGIYRKKVERLAEALQDPKERDEAAEAKRTSLRNSGPRSCRRSPHR